MSSSPAEDRASIHEIKDLAAAKYVRDHGFAGVGVTNPIQKITVYVNNEGDKERVPDTIGGYQTKAVVAGNIRALGYSYADRRTRYRPAIGGISVSNAVETGSLSAVLMDNTTGRKVMLSNAHVFAGGGLTGAGSPIYQPGVADGGSATSRIGVLRRYTNIIPAMQGINLVDAAVAEPDSQDLLQYGFLGPDGNIQQLTGWTNPRIGDRVYICGRTSGYKESEIIDVTGVMKAGGYAVGDAIFTPTIVMEPALSGPGDSGSLIFNKDTGKVVGILFAGSETLSLGNWISNALGVLNLTMITQAGASQGEYTPPASTGVGGSGLPSINDPSVQAAIILGLVFAGAAGGAAAAHFANKRDKRSR